MKKEWIEKGYVDEQVDASLDLKKEIRQLCKEKDAIILAHYYTVGDIQDIADFVGEIFGGGKGRITDGDDKAIADEGLYTYADVNGNTFVTLAKDQGVQINDEKKEEDNFSINVIWNRK